MQRADEKVKIEGVVKMLWWHILLVAIAARYAGKQIAKWLDIPLIKKEFVELIEVIEKAREDRKITVEEIPGIIEEAVDVVKAILKKKEE